MEGVWATIFICHLIFGGHLLNIPKKKKKIVLFFENSLFLSILYENYFPKTFLNAATQ